MEDVRFSKKRQRTACRKRFSLLPLWRWPRLAAYLYQGRREIPSWLSLPLYDKDKLQSCAGNWLKIRSPKNVQSHSTAVKLEKFANAKQTGCYFHCWKLRILPICCTYYKLLAGLLKNSQVAENWNRYYRCAIYRHNHNSWVRSVFNVKV